MCRGADFHAFAGEVEEILHMVTSVSSDPLSRYANEKLLQGLHTYLLEHSDITTIDFNGDLFDLNRPVVFDRIPPDPHLLPLPDLIAEMTSWVRSQSSWEVRETPL